MAASILYLVMIFGGLSVVALLLVAANDAIAAYFERRSERASQVAAHEGLPLLLAPRSRTVASRARRAPLPLVLRSGAEPLRGPSNEPANDRPVWLDAAQRDVAHR